jgi:hypothetical protein
VNAKPVPLLRLKIRRAIVASRFDLILCIGDGGGGPHGTRAQGGIPRRAGKRVEGAEEEIGEGPLRYPASAFRIPASIFAAASDCMCGETWEEMSSVMPTMAYPKCS